MFKIGDFSRIGQVSVRMLRYYDKLGLLTPDYTDPFTSYRYYTIEQLARLNRIVALNEMGLTLHQIAGLLDKRGGLSIDQLRGMLILRQAEIERELQDKQLQLTSVAARLRQIEYEREPSPYEVVVKSVELLNVASVRTIVPHSTQMHDYCKSMFHQLYAELERFGIEPVGHEMTLYHNDEYTETDLDVQTSVQIELSAALTGTTSGLTIVQLPPAPLVAALVHENGYAEVGVAVLALFAWTGSHGFTVAGPLREIHLSGSALTAGKQGERVVIELQVPITKVE